MSSNEIFELLEKASSLISNGDLSKFKDNFSEISAIVKKIPGHSDLVDVNGFDNLEEWQLSEFKNTLLEQLNKTKQTWQQLKSTGVDN